MRSCNDNSFLFFIIVRAFHHLKNIYDKLSSTGEIIALQSCGISLYKLIYPAINLSLILSLILFI
ncbi:MAG: LptF/LptG family permease, partial [Dolichospermum sp.]